MGDRLLGIAFLGLICFAKSNGYSDHMDAIFNYIQPGDRYVTRSKYDAMQKVKRAIGRTNIEWNSDEKWNDPMTLFQFFKRPPTSKSAQMAEANDIFESAINIIFDNVSNDMKRMKRRVNITDILSDSTLQSLMEFSGCKANKQIKECPNNCFVEKYRSITGECNNLLHPDWGVASNPLVRWLGPIYENDFSDPIGWNENKTYNGIKIPMVRKISNDIMHTDNRRVSDDSLYSHLLVLWGQYIDHDIDFTPQSLSTSTFQGTTDCKKTCEKTPPCFPMPVPGDDERIKEAHCLPFFRSAAVCGTGDTSGLFSKISHREQMNGITPFIDASLVYGSDMEMHNKLRDWTDGNIGKLKVNDKYTDNGRAYLPFQENSPCVQDPDNPDAEPIPCFLAGDGRVSEHVPLSAIHTLWLREHNFIFDRLKQINPHWSSEVLFHETRKIIGSMHQVVNYKEYLPKIIGKTGMDMMGPPQYNQHMKPDVSNVFATAAFRFGHTTIAPIVRRLDENNIEHPEYKNFPLHKGFFSPWRLIREGGLDPVMRGIIERPAKLVKSDELMHEELREKLFALQNKVALDLASLNLQRGRDHGLPLYNSWRKFCNLSEANTFDDLQNEITSAEIREKLQNLYKHPGNIDIWLAGLLEDLVSGARVGPTFLCMMVKQFKALRDGDRFYYTHPGVHTSTQLAELEKFTFAHIICHNTGVTRVRPDVFSLSGDRIDCSELNQDRSFNLNAWRESPEVLNCGIPSSIEYGEWTKCPMSNEVHYKCRPGYEMFGSEKIMCRQDTRTFSSSPPSCRDIDECSMPLYADKCEDMCVNTQGSFRCGCEEGRVLNSDGFTCSDEGVKVSFQVDNTVTIVLGSVLGATLVLVFILGAICLYKYVTLKSLFKYNGTPQFKVVPDANSNVITNQGASDM